MLSVILKPHRTYLRANAGPQKLFVMVKVVPTPEAAQARPRVDLAVVIDTSGSMREPAPGQDVEVVPIDPVTVDGKTYTATYKGSSKLNLAMEATRRLVESDYLDQDDRVSLIQFDDRAELLARGTAGADRPRLLEAIKTLRNYSGGTEMGRGLRTAEKALGQEPNTAPTVLLLTDGLTIDEEECREAAAELARHRARVIALGVGEEYNEDLLGQVASITQGRQLLLDDMTTLPEIWEQELGSATRQVISDLQLSLKTVRDVRLASAVRAYPNLADLDPGESPLKLGNVAAGDYTVFVLELDLPERPPVRARIAQAGLTYWVPAQRYRGEVGPLDLVLEYTDDEGLAATVDSEVMAYVQQRNVDSLVRQATDQAKRGDAALAGRTLQLARSMTQRIGNQGMTVALGAAEDELRRSGTISASTAKTIKIGARTQTVKPGGPDDLAGRIPSEEEIRRLTGA